MYRRMVVRVSWAIVAQVCLLAVQSNAAQYPQPILQTGQNGEAWSMAFSPGGAMLAVASDHRISLWDRQHQWLVRNFIGHSGTVQALAFDRSGKTLASGTVNGELATWDVDTGKLLKLRKVNTSEIAGVKYMPDGRLLTAGWDDTLRIWDGGKCEASCILAQTAVSPMSLAVSTDGKWIGVGDTADTITVWQRDVGTDSVHLYRALKLSNIQSDANFVRGIAFDHLGHLAAVDFAGAIVFQALDPWATVFRQETGLRLDAAAVSNDDADVYVAGTGYPNVGRILAFGAANGTRKTLYETPAYWSAVAGNPYRSVALSPDGRWLVAGSTYLLQWDLSSKGSPEVFGKLMGVTLGAILTPNADSVVIPLQGVHLFSFLRGYFATLPQPDGSKPLRAFPYGQSAVSADDQWVATPGLSQEFVRFVQQKCGSQPGPQFDQCTQNLSQQKDLPPEMSLLLFRGSDLTLMTEFESDGFPQPQFSGDGQVLVWRAKGGLMTVETRCMCNERLVEASLPSDDLVEPAVDESGKSIAISDPRTRGAVEVFNTETRSVSSTVLLEPSGYIHQLTFNSARSDDTKMLAVGMASGNIYTWRLKDGAVERLQGKSPVTSLAFSRDGNSLVAGREDGSLTVVSLQPRKISELKNAHFSAVAGVRFGFGGRWIESSAQEAIRFWDSRDLSDMGTLIFPLQGGTLSWLFVTPQGLFDGEPRALASILWRFSPRLSDVGPVELFARDYFHQGVMRDVLLGQPIPRPRAVASRNRRLPVVSVSVKVADKSRPVKTHRVTVNIHLERAIAADGVGEEVKDVRLLRNGLLVKHWHGVIATNLEDLTFDAPVTRGINEFTAYAFNSDDIKSLDATDGVLGDASLAVNGITYILSIGVDNYSPGIPSLHYSGNDARAFVEGVSRMQTGETIRAVTLVGGDATRGNILCGLNRLRSDVAESPSCSLAQLNDLKPTNPEDRVYIFFSGHGVTEGNHFAILPRDATSRTSEGLDRSGRYRNAITDVDLERELEPILAGQQVLVIDACSAGSLITTAKPANPVLNLDGFAQLALEKGIYILTAATANQSAMEGPKNGPGSGLSIMNYVLLEEGLVQGKADRKRPDGSLLIEDWFNYAAVHVPSVANQQPVAFVPIHQEDTQPGVVGYFKRQ